MSHAIPALSSPGMILNWKMDEGGGLTLSNSSGTSNVGALKNGAAFALRDAGYALSFAALDGRYDDRVVLAPLTGTFSDQFSISLWMRSNDPARRGALFSYAVNKPAVSPHEFSLIDPANLTLFVRGSSVATNVAVNDGTWHHIVTTWSNTNGEYRLFVDGTLEAEGFLPHHAVLATNGILVLGQDQESYGGGFLTSKAYIGELDDLRVYARALSAAEAQWLFNPVADTTPPSRPTELAGTAVTATQVNLTWSPSSDDQGVAGYRIWRNDVALGTVAETKFADFNAPVGTSNTYILRAFDVLGNESADSEAITVVTPTATDIFSTLPVGHWYEVLNSSLAGYVTSTGGAPPNVMRPWSGAAYDNRRSRLVVWGGGHGDYWGNELYAFDMITLRWQQLTERTPYAQATKSVDSYVDGRPSSRHTYGGLQYIPTIDRFFSSGGSVWGSGSCIGGTWLFDFTAMPAENGWSRLADSKGGCGMVSAFDSATGHVWYATGAKLFEFNPLNLVAPWTQRASNLDFKFYLSAAIDTARRKLMPLGGDNGKQPGLRAYNIGALAPSVVTGGRLTTYGANEIEKSNPPGFAYDSSRDRLVAWNGIGFGGGFIHVFNSDTQTWTRRSPASTNISLPTAPASNGTYGRFQYVPDKNVLILVNAIADNVFLYKLPVSNGSSTPMPSLSFSPSSTTVPAGGYVTLNWSAPAQSRCVASGTTPTWLGNKSTTGSITLGPLPASMSNTYIMACRLDDFVLTQSAKVSAAAM